MTLVISNATLLIAVVSATWVVWLFFAKRQGEPGGELQLDLDFIGKQDNKWLIEVCAILTNRSQVRYRYRDFRLKIRYFLADDEIKDGGYRIMYQLECPRSIDERDNSINRDHRFFANAAYIDPGLEFRHSYITYVPAEATFVWVQCELLFPSWYQLLRWRNGEKEKLSPEEREKLRLKFRVKNAQKLFKVPNEATPLS